MLADLTSRKNIVTYIQMCGRNLILTSLFCSPVTRTDSSRDCTPSQKDANGWAVKLWATTEICEDYAVAIYLSTLQSFSLDIK